MFVCGVSVIAYAACQKADSVSPRKAPIAPAGDEVVPIETVAVAGPIHALIGRGGNVGVSAGADGVLIIDDQFAPQVPGILAAVRALGKGDPQRVINTHFHGDHTGGNPALGKTATIIAHANVRARLSTAQTVRGKQVDAMAPEGWPVLTFEDSVRLYMNGEEIQIVHFPNGHTDGNSVVFFIGSKVVHMGDHFFNGGFPFIDLDHGGTVSGYIRNVGAVLERIGDDVRVIPGHGPVGGKAELAAFHAMLVDTAGIVSKAKRAGKTLAEIKKAGLPAKYAELGAGFVTTDAWIETLYNGS